MQPGDWVALGAAIVALLAMLVTIWQASEARKSRRAAERQATYAEESAQAAHTANDLSRQQAELERAKDKAARAPDYTLVWERTMGEPTGWQHLVLTPIKGPDLLSLEIRSMTPEVDRITSDDGWGVWGTDGHVDRRTHPGLPIGKHWPIQCRLTSDVDQISLTVIAQADGEEWVKVITSVDE